MTNEELFKQCLDAAQRIVAAERDAYNGADAMAFDVSVGGGTTSQEFQRTGTSSQQKDYQLPSGLASLIEQTYQNSSVPASLASGEQQMLAQMLALVPTALPYLSALSGTAQIDPTEFTGSGTLGTVAQRNPYSDDWEAGTQDAYERAYGTARAAAQSGPERVRGGQARAGYELADMDTAASAGRFREVEDQKLKETGVVRDAIQTANAIEMARRGGSMAAQGQTVQQELQRRGIMTNASDILSKLRGNTLASTAMASEFLSKPKVTTTDDMRGAGNQSTFNWGAGAGLSCCFILNAVRGGELPWWVRWCRDHLGDEGTRRGYRRMAKWLVPWMRRSETVRMLVDAVMLHPLTEYGGWLLRVPGREGGFVFAPVKRFWFAVWNQLGKE